MSEVKDPMRKPANALSHRELGASGRGFAGRIVRCGAGAVALALAGLLGAAPAGLAAAAATPAPASAGAAATAPATLKVLASDATGVTLQFTLPPYEVTSVDLPEGTFARLAAHGLSSTVAEEGRPLLPAAA